MVISFREKGTDYKSVHAGSVWPGGKVGKWKEIVQFTQEGLLSGVGIIRFR